MTKQQESNDLKRKISKFEIYLTINLLETKLNDYRNSRKVLKNGYEFKAELNSISDSLSSLRNRIEAVLEKN
jgi:hypothetical protein